METKFEIGDVVRLTKNEYWGTNTLRIGHEGTVSTNQTTIKFAPDVVMVDGFPCYEYNLTLVRRASAQREGGFSVGQRVRVARDLEDGDSIGTGEAGVIVKVGTSVTFGGAQMLTIQGEHGQSVRLASRCDVIEPADPATALPEAPPQPAPMTRAARVLALMEQDPYEQARNEVEARIGLDTQNHLDHYTATATDNEPEQQAARLRMAKISLDRPLDAERARWERLVLAKVPVGRR